MPLESPPSQNRFGHMASVVTIITGGQTGVDRAALDAAMELSIPCGG